MNGPLPTSRLPDDPAYWEGLATRSVAAALATDLGTPPVTRPVPWWHWLSASGYRLAAGAAIVALMATLLRGERTVPAPATPEPLATLVVPKDPLLQAVLETGTAAPDHNQMLRLVALRAEER